MSATTQQPALVRDTRILGGRAVALWSRNPASIVGAVVFPLIFFTMFNLTMRNVMQARGFDYAQLLPPTVVVQAMFFTAMSSAYWVASDRLTGMTGRLRSMPVHPAAPIIARSVGDASRSVLSAIVLIIAGVAAGMRFRAGFPAALAFVAVAVLFAIVIAIGIGLLGYSASTPEGASAVASIFYLPLLMLSNGFAPVTDFPGWLQPFVEHQPVTRTIDLLRVLVNGGPTWQPFLWWIIWMIALGTVFVILSARLFRRGS